MIIESNADGREPTNKEERLQIMENSQYVNCDHTSIYNFFYRFINKILKRVRQKKLKKSTASAMSGNKIRAKNYSLIAIRS